MKVIFIDSSFKRRSRSKASKNFEKHLLVIGAYRILVIRKTLQSNCWIKILFYKYSIVSTIENYKPIQYVRPLGL